jgi:hypothetical protein
MGEAVRSGRTGAAARLMIEQPERLSAAWRRELWTRTGDERDPAQNLLDGVVEDFVRRVGMMLEGRLDVPWSYTRGVLRLCSSRGASSLYDEFAALRRCLLDALETLGGSAGEAQAVIDSVDEALASAVALYRRMNSPDAAPPVVPFGGLVVELFERRHDDRDTALGDRVSSPGLSLI